jgi:cell division protein FtsB
LFHIVRDRVFGNMPELYMSSRLIAAALLALLVALQWPVWFGKGGWFKVWERQGELSKQERTNEEKRLRNAALEADVRDLKDGSGAIEERARQELGMIKKGEVFVQVLQGSNPAAPAAAPATPGGKP